MSGPISALVEDAVACMTHEAPVAYQLMAQALGARRFELAIDDEHFMLDVMAGPDDVAAAAAAMTYFVQGAMRCVSMRPLIDRLEGLRKERT
jgi:hypothetical protein